MWSLKRDLNLKPAGTGHASPRPQDDMQTTWTFVATVSDVEDDVPLAVTCNDHEIAIYRYGDDFFATDNICTHAHAYLSDGFQEGCTIECPLHAGCFDIRTGKALTAPLTEDIRTYPVRIEGENVLVGLPG
jgi:naphthalene 1,2-dioxygenase system ferredoxin subunit